MQLSAQLGEVRVDHTLQRIALGQAVLDQISAGEAAPRLCCQAGQQTEFGQRQRQRYGKSVIPVDQSAVRLLINLDRPHAQGRGHGGGGSLGAAQHGPHPGHNLRRIKGLDHIVVGPHAQGQQLVHIIGQGRHHDDRRLPFVANLTQHIHAIHLGQMNVEQDQVRPQLSE